MGGFGVLAKYALESDVVENEWTVTLSQGNEMSDKKISGAWRAQKWRFHPFCDHAPHTNRGVSFPGAVKLQKDIFAYLDE